MRVIWIPHQMVCELNCEHILISSWIIFSLMKAKVQWIAASTSFGLISEVHNNNNNNRRLVRKMCCNLWSTISFLCLKYAFFIKIDTYNEEKTYVVIGNKSSSMSRFCDFFHGKWENKCTLLFVMQHVCNVQKNHKNRTPYT